MDVDLADSSVPVPKMLSMHILRMRDAAYARRGETIVAPTSLDLGPGHRLTHVAANAREARGLAMLAAGLARATAGSVSIGEYDPRVQPAHCKRIAAFVAHDPLPLSQIDTAHYIAYRAALWDIDPDDARVRAQALLERLAPMHEAFAFPIAAALVPSPHLLVLDRPQAAFVPQILAAAAGCAVLVVRAEERG